MRWKTRHNSHRFLRPSRGPSYRHTYTYIDMAVDEPEIEHSLVDYFGPFEVFEYPKYFVMRLINDEIALAWQSKHKIKFTEHVEDVIEAAGGRCAFFYYSSMHVSVEKIRPDALRNSFDHIIRGHVSSDLCSMIVHRLRDRRFFGECLIAYTGIYGPEAALSMLELLDYWKYLKK